MESVFCANCQSLQRRVRDIRETASQGLQELGIVAEPAMRRALSQKPSLEVRRHLEQILDRLESGARPIGELRILRAFEVLQLVASAESRQVLRELSQGSPDSWLTREAKTALARFAPRLWADHKMVRA